MIEAGIWCAAALLSAPAAQWVSLRWPTLRKATPLAPWVYGLGPPFAALMRGAVQPREFGLEGFRAQDWLTGALISAAVVAGATLALRARPIGWERLDPVNAVLDEARWGLYRAAGVAWTAFVLPGAVIGLALSLDLCLARRGDRTRAQPCGGVLALGDPGRAQDLGFLEASHLASASHFHSALHPHAKCLADRPRSGRIDPGSVGLIPSWGQSE